MFTNNKYLRWYNNTIDHAKGQHRDKSQGYFELHHIIPRSLGGNDGPDNLVLLTAREHFICHMMLSRCTEGVNKLKMAKAVSMMTKSSSQQQRYNGKIYECDRRAVAAATSAQFKGKALSSDHREKISAALTGLCKTEQHKDRLRGPRPSVMGAGNHMFGKVHTTQTKDKISQSKKLHPNTFTDEQRKQAALRRHGKSWDDVVGVEKANEMRSEASQRMSGSNNPRYGKVGVNKGKSFSQESRSKMSNSWENRHYECPHCKKTSKNMANLQRWHFDNCKLYAKQLIKLPNQILT